MSNLLQQHCKPRSFFGSEAFTAVYYQNQQAVALGLKATIFFNASLTAGCWARSHSNSDEFSTST